MRLSERSLFQKITTTQESTINIATAADQAAIVDVMVRAFHADPVVRWAWPDPQSYVADFSSFVRVFGGRAFSQGSAYFAEGYAGAALWLPPNIHPDEEALGDVLERTVPEDRKTDLFRMFEEMDRYHPSEPNWYLPLIGVDPSRQGRGYGSALMKSVLTQCDRTQTPAYLEATSAESASLYQRHGFEQLGTIQVGTSSPLFPMFRQPQ